MPNLAGKVRLTIRLEADGTNFSKIFPRDDLDAWTPDAKLVEWKKAIPKKYSEAVFLYMMTTRPTTLEMVEAQIQGWAEKRTSATAISVNLDAELGEWPGVPRTWQTDPMAYLMNGMSIAFFVGITLAVFPKLRPPMPRIVWGKPRGRRSTDFDSDDVLNWMKSHPEKARGLLERLGASMVSSSPSTSAVPTRYGGTTPRPVQQSFGGSRRSTQQKPWAETGGSWSDF